MIITDRLTIEKMASDMFLYPHYPEGFDYGFDFNELRYIRRGGRFSLAYTETLHELTLETIDNQLDIIESIAPQNIKTWLLYYTIHPSLEIDDKICMYMLYHPRERNFISRGNWYSPGIILSNEATENSVQINALFTTLNARNPEEDKMIAREIEKYCYAYFVRTVDNKWLCEDSEEDPCCPY